MSNENAVILAKDLDPTLDPDFLTNTFACPCCGHQLQFRIQMNVRGVREVGTASVNRPAEIVRIYPVADAMKEAGVWDAFQSAYDQLMPSVKPGSVLAYAETWLPKVAVIKRLPPSTMNRLIEEYGYGRIVVWGWQCLCAITVDGVVRGFVPMALLKGESFYQLTPEGGQITRTKDPMTLPIWIRTKYGYVAHGKGAFFGAIRKRCIGEFAR
jgi:hypothetical protein